MQYTLLHEYWWVISSRKVYPVTAMTLLLHSSRKVYSGTAITLLLHSSRNIGNIDDPNAHTVSITFLAWYRHFRRKWQDKPNSMNPLILGKWCWKKQSIRGRPQTCLKSLPNLTTQCCIDYTSPWVDLELTKLAVIDTDCLDRFFYLTTIRT